MTTPINPNHRAIASLLLPKSNTMGLIIIAQAIVKAMTANPSFPSPTPTLAAVTAAINDLQSAENAALARTKGAVATRNAKRGALVKLLQQLKAYVQTTADADAQNGAPIVEGAGMSVRKTPTRMPRTFRASSGAVSGTASLVAPAAARRASYEWQYSADGGKTWVTAPVSLQAKTIVAGLQPGATVQFKYRPVTKGGEENWSQAVSLVVQ